MSPTGVALIVLPLLVSGFLFALVFYPTRFISAKFDGQRLFFLAATIGICFALAASLLYPSAQKLSFEYWPWPHFQPEALIARAFPIDNAGALIGCVILAFVTAIALNGLLCIRLSFRERALHFRSGWKWTIDKLIRRVGDPLQQLLIRAVTQQKKVFVSLKSGRAYIGFVYRTPPRPHVETSYIELLTEYSLFRDEKGKVPSREHWSVYPGAKLAELRAWIGTLTDSLHNIRGLEAAPQETRDKMANLVSSKLEEAKSTLSKLEEFGDLAKEDWVRVIPVGEIESICFFDEKVFDWFKAHDSSHVMTPSPAV